MPLRVGCRADDADKHELDVNYLLFHKGTLYSAGDDGKVKAWSSDLTKQAEVQSNPCSVFSLTASNSDLFSCSNEGTIKTFDLKTLKETSVVTKEGIEYWRVVYANDHLYSGDDEGYIKVWKNGLVIGSVNIAEPIKDMVVYNDLVFTVKDVDVVVTNVILGGPMLQYGTKNDFPGRAPITTIGDKFIGFISREGMDIVIHENNDASHFKAVTKVEGASEKIINALAGAKWNEKYVLFSGGWDKQVKKWYIDEDMVKMDCSIDVEFVVNTITLGEKGEIYVGGADGHMVRIEVE